MSDEPGPYELRVTGPACRQLDGLLPKIAVAVVEFMLGELIASPRRVGGQLRRELSGLWSARRGSYRIIYAIDDAGRVVIVHRVDHRATAYRPR